MSKKDPHESKAPGVITFLLVLLLVGGGAYWLGSNEEEVNKVLKEKAPAVEQTINRSRDNFNSNVERLTPVVKGTFEDVVTKIKNGLQVLREKFNPNAKPEKSGSGSQ